MVGITTTEAIQTDWSKYYEGRTTNLGDRSSSYITAMKRLHEQVPTFLSSSPKTFLLGGFVGSNGTPRAFDELCSAVHDNPADKHIYLDLNSQPFKSPAYRFGHKLGVQANLAKLPFGEDSIDVIVLDGTTYFMDGETLQEFAERAGRILTKNGVIIVAKLPKWIGRYQQQKLYTNKLSIKVYPQNDSDLTTLLGSYLKPIYHKPLRFVRGYDTSILAFGRKDSDFKTVEIIGPDSE